MRISGFVVLLFFLISCEDINTTVPKSYQNVSPPDKKFLNDSENIDAGKHLYQRHCAICHGQNGRGDGYAGYTQSLKPTNLTALTTMTSQSLDYLFWRISEGGTIEPFHSQGSIMPAWKYQLSETERWQIIAFIRHLTKKRKSDVIKNPF